MSHFEKTLNSEMKFKGKIINLRVDEVELEDGSISTREIVEHPGGVCVVAADENGQIYMVKQYRKPVEKVLLELPAGKLNYGEDHRECGIRELEEETGIKANNFEYLGYFIPSPGFLNEKIHIYLATDLSIGNVNLDEDEFLSVEKYYFNELLDMIDQGKIHDSKTIIGLLLYERKIRVK